MIFSIYANEQFRYDMRAVPFVIGGLFGGPLVAIGLLFSLFLSRLLIGGFDYGFLGNLINYSLLALLIVVSARWFQSSGMKRKVLISFIIMCFHILLSFLVYTYIFVSGLPFDVFIQASLIKLAFTVLIVMTVEGIFRQYRMRDRLINMEKMELISHLSAAISHEVRNGLTSAHGFLQLLDKQETDPKKRSYIRYALDELNRTESIVGDFLTFAKPVPRQISQIQLDKLILNSISIVEPLANMSSIEIRKYLMPFIIQADERLLQQSLINMFKNAIEAMPNGGLLEIHMTSDQKEYLITIKDTGVGMTEEQISRIGTPYYTTKGQKGTGLGMMVAFRVIQKLNGHVKVYSQVGVGTTFVIHLPKAA
jgi:two-component system sporulation sensor kinase B